MVGYATMASIHQFKEMLPISSALDPTISISEGSSEFLKHFTNSRFLPLRQFYLKPNFRKVKRQKSFYEMVKISCQRSKSLKR